MSGVQREVREREKIRRKSQREKETDAIFQCNFTMVCLVFKTYFSSASSPSSERSITREERLQDRSQPSHELTDWTRV